MFGKLSEYIIFIASCLSIAHTYPHSPYKREVRKRIQIIKHTNCLILFYFRFLRIRTIRAMSPSIEKRLTSLFFY